MGKKSFIDDLRMLFKGIIILFSPGEIKEAYGTIYEIDREISHDWDATIAWRSVRFTIEEYLILRQKIIVAKMRTERVSPRKFVFNMTYNITSDEIDALSGDSMSMVGSMMRGYKNLNRHVTKKINRLDGH